MPTGQARTESAPAASLMVRTDTPPARRSGSLIGERAGEVARARDASPSALTAAVPSGCHLVSDQRPVMEISRPSDHRQSAQPPLDDSDTGQ